ncbi:hypothetical protein CVO77_00370 [Sphingopyxis lindanitolerans]|uniref:Uncharacterized protein n=1 Tax=Sphingopyxis lindanitolerans TaxID=2054227 RepID=A0A2S8BAP2_9SPHN|nr:hypothetical protein [Sphingopyxis lindanitolerans]PQM29427.1 hypothetical protein CVO77_00370 [Sphingopyxis lindanitolerans]
MNYTDAREAFNRASHSDALPEMQIVAAETLQPDTDEQPRALVTSLWIAAAFLVAAHVIWVAADMPGAQFLNRLMETLP